MSSETEAGRYAIGSQLQIAPTLPAGLYIVATPIGNLGDITIRALATLAAVDTILCEDTRNASKLLNHFGIKRRLQPYHDHNASRVRPAIIEQLKSGRSFALISDAGTPLINDPGYKLVRDAIESNLRIEMLPGASAPVMALALSGLPSDRFLFAGFLPPKKSARCKALEELGQVKSTLIFFESAQRIGACLEDIAAVLPCRQIAVARELTKLFQEVLRGNAEVVSRQIEERGGIKGEITIVIGPPAEPAKANEAEIDEKLVVLMSQMSVSQAASELAKQTGISKRLIYARALELKDEIPH